MMSRVLRGVSKQIFMRFFQVFFALVFFALTGCTAKAPNAAKTEAAKSEEREVNLAIWSNYLSPEMQTAFTKKTGVKIRVSNYASNEELLAKVQAGASGIDVAVPSDYMVDVMIKLGLLHELDAAQIPNRAGVQGDFLKQEYDRENRYSLPYAWTTAGLAVHRELFKGSIKGWKDLYENKELTGKISLLDDVREVTASALKMLGYSVNTTNQDELNKAKEALKKLRPRVKMFRSDTIDALLNKEVAVAHAYSADALQAAKRSAGKIEYVLPEEGGTRAIDNLVILKNAHNLAAAHALIDFLLGRDANVSFVSNVMGGPVLSATKELLPSALQLNSALFPSAVQMAKFERIRDVGSATSLYDRLWTEVKSD